jgi:ubiquinone/menaquinone biosynthesis C-methylase UbiE
MQKPEINEIIKKLKSKDRVYSVEQSATHNNFEADYIALRKKENRLYSDGIVKQLPNGKETSHPDEWKMRNKSAKRVMSYFRQQDSSEILDLGCGNGWFSAQLAGSCNCEVVGVDLNLTELQQAAKVFEKPNLNFVYADIFQWPKENDLFDFVTINAAIQYFPDFDKLIKRLFTLLKEGGEVHVIDSPFYKKVGVEAAKIRSLKYYSEMGFEEMADNYFHHTFEELNEFDFEMMYEPRKDTFFSKLFKEKDIPFPWVKIKKT